MIAPSTTTPATTMTRRSSLSSEEAAGPPTWLSISVLMRVVLSSSSVASRHRSSVGNAADTGDPISAVGAAVRSGAVRQVVADLAAQPEGDVGRGQQR